MECHTLVLEKLGPRRHDWTFKTSSHNTQTIPCHNVTELSIAIDINLCSDQLWTKHHVFTTYINTLTQSDNIQHAPYIIMNLPTVFDAMLL